MRGRTRLLVICGLAVAWVGLACDHVQAQRRLPLINRIQERIRLRAELYGDPGQATPRRDPNTGQVPSAGVGDQRTGSLSAAPTQPPYRPWRLWRSQLDAAAGRLNTTQRVPTLAPPRQIAGQQVPTPAPRKSTTNVPSPEQVESAVRQAVSIMTVPGGTKPSDRPVSEASPAASEGPLLKPANPAAKEHRGPREF